MANKFWKKEQWFWNDFHEHDTKKPHNVQDGLRKVRRAAKRKEAKDAMKIENIENPA